MNEKPLAFDVQSAVYREAERRKNLLGATVLSPTCPHEQLRERAERVGVPYKTLWSWWYSYRDHGLDGLRPTTWDVLGEAEQASMVERLQQLGDIAERIEATDQDIQTLVERNGWSERTAQRWLQRYRVGGVWALARSNDPEKHSAKVQSGSPRRSFASLDEAALATIEERLEKLGTLVKQKTVTRKEVEAQAKNTKVAVSTLWGYLNDYHEYGPLGLAPQERADKTLHHKLSPRVIKMIQGFRYNHPKASIKTLHTEICKRTLVLGEPSPTLWQVRSICDQLSETNRLLADGDEKRFRDRAAITISMHDLKMEEFLIIYELDHTQVDVLVEDIRPEHLRTKSGEIRPWLTLCIDRRSRLVMAAIFSYDRPDRHTVAAAIREAVLVSDEKPYGGVPNEIWVDRGKELLATHIHSFTQELKVILHPCTPHYPQEKGIVERFFGVLNTRLWVLQPGYVDSNTVERSPRAKAELTIAELEARFKAFIEVYHHEVHSQTKFSPLEYWQEYCWAERVDVRTLDRLLKEAKGRMVLKSGIKYQGRMYWHTALATVVRKTVVIRAAPTYVVPDEIEVYHNDTWLCTAYALDSPSGRAFTRQDVVSAKQDQRATIKHEIAQGREVAEDAEKEFHALQQQTQALQQPSLQSAEVQETPGELPKQKQEPPSLEQHSVEKRKEGKGDFLDLVVNEFEL